MAVNAADVTVAAYGRRKPRYPVITETLGLALVLLIIRNTARDRAVWLSVPEISDALRRPAETFAAVLEMRAPEPGWRGGALASLRSLTPGALHEVTSPWPYNRRADREPLPAARFWRDDDERWHWSAAGTRPAVRGELVRRLAGHPRIGEARDALLSTFSDGTGCSRHRIRGTLAARSSHYEDPHTTRQLHAEIVEERDPAAEQAARHAKLLAGYQARNTTKEKS